ncbi:MAG: hypothetical protein KAU02_03975 [Tenericutes bacterium]|nr:hypothetical protein [Mycoplasmatota bacterium]
MSDLQDRVLQYTKYLLYKFSFVYIIIYTLFTGILIVATAYLFNIEITIFVILISAAIALGWTVFKEYLNYQRTDRQIEKQHNYLINKNPNITLYIPVFRKLGMRLVLKNATLFFINDNIYMEAYKQLRLKKDILESVTIKLGRELLIGDSVESKNQKYITYEANLMYEDYSFSVINIKEVIDLIEKNKGEKYDKNTTHKSSKR